MLDDTASWSTEPLLPFLPRRPPRSSPLGRPPRSSRRAPGKPVAGAPGAADATGRGGWNGVPVATGRGRGAPGTIGRGRGRSELAGCDGDWLAGADCADGGAGGADGRGAAGRCSAGGAEGAAATGGAAFGSSLFAGASAAGAGMSAASTGSGAGGGVAARRRDGAAGASGVLTSATAIVSGSAGATGASAARRRLRPPASAAGSGAAGGGSTAAAPRRRRAGAAAGAVARALFSRSHRALMRATWSSESGVIWLRTGTSICRRRFITSSTEIPNSPAMSFTRSLLKHYLLNSFRETDIGHADYCNTFTSCNIAELRRRESPDDRDTSCAKQR